MDGEPMNKQQILIALGLAVLCFGGGLAGLLWPERVQRFALTHSTGRLQQKFNPWLGWMKTRQYVWSLRLSGAIGVGMGVVLLVLLVKSLIRAVR